MTKIMNSWILVFSNYFIVKNAVFNFIAKAWNLMGTRFHINISYKKQKMKNYIKQMKFTCIIHLTF